MIWWYWIIIEKVVSGWVVIVLLIVVMINVSFEVVLVVRCLEVNGRFVEVKCFIFIWFMVVMVMKFEVVIVLCFIMDFVIGLVVGEVVVVVKLGYV